MITETWLHQDTPDDKVSISDLQTVWTDQDRTERGQHEGGRLAVLVKDHWWDPGYINIKECIGCPDVELLAVGQAILFIQGFHTPLL